VDLKAEKPPRPKGNLKSAEALLRKNLEEAEKRKLPDDWVVVPLVRVAATKNLPLLLKAEKAGYDVNRASNALARPYAAVNAKWLERHLSELVRRLLELEQAAKKDAGVLKPWSEQRLLDELARLENELRALLLEADNP
jgi:hypothetical protein